MLRCYFDLRLAKDPGFAPHLAPFNALCSSLDAVLDFKYGLRSTDSASVGELVAVYGDGHTRPKQQGALTHTNRAKGAEIMFGNVRMFENIRKLSETVTAIAAHPNHNGSSGS